MQFFRIFLFATLVGGFFILPTRLVYAQPSVELRQAESEFAVLKSRLDRLNREIAALKRTDRSLRNDYRLRDRLAEAEDLAQKVTQKEALVHRLRGALPTTKTETIIAEAPQATAEDNPFELEAKADLLADQSVQLRHEADRLRLASEESRKRQAMRRQAGKWDRDPFASFEASKRQVPAQVGKATSTPTSNGRGTTLGTSGASDTKVVGEGNAIALPDPKVSVPGDFATTGAGAPPPTQATQPPSAVRGPTQPTAPVVTESATGTAKTAPVPVTIGSVDRGGGDYRIFLDPSTAALLRSALRAEGAPYDPESLLRASVVLRTRAETLSKEAKDLRARSRRP